MRMLASRGDSLDGALVVGLQPEPLLVLVPHGQVVRGLVLEVRGELVPGVLPDLDALPALLSAEVRQPLKKLPFQ